MASWQNPLHRHWVYELMAWRITHLQNSRMRKFSRYALAMSRLNTNSPKPLNHPRRDWLFSPQHPPEIWPTDAK